MMNPPEGVAPARIKPQERHYESSDLTRRTCVHELARALEQYARKEYIPLFSTTAEFEDAALEVAALLGEEKCPLRR